MGISKSFKILGATVLLTSASMGGAAAQKAISLGTSSVGSSFYVVSVAIAKMASKHEKLNVAVESVGGSHANMFAIARGKIDFATANSSAVYDLYHGKKPFKKGFDVRLVAQGHPTLRWFIGTKRGGISKLSHINGKTISSIRRPLPELKEIMDAMVKVHGLKKIKHVASSTTRELDGQMRAGTVDGALMPFSLRQPVIVKLFRDDMIQPLVLSDPDFEKVRAALPPKFFRFDVPANNFKNQPQKFPVLGLNAVMVTSPKMDDNTVYKMLRSFMSHQKEFRTFHGSAKFWSPKRATLSPPVPFHPGAIKYYKEAGMWTPALEAKQAQLLKK
jgi:TRAP transporter TAXI family solute receptor